MRLNASTRVFLVFLLLTSPFAIHHPWNPWFGIDVLVYSDIFRVRMFFISGGVGLINKSSILTAFSIINHPFGGTPMTMETSISLELIWFDKRRTQQDQGLKPWGAPSPFNASEYKTPWFPVGFLCFKTMRWTNWQLKACKSVAITCHNWEYLLTRHFCQGIWDWSKLPNPISFSGVTLCWGFHNDVMW